ncbi:hypothetical protein SALB1_1078 [Salinisphaera sp. LB1]|nr:hypothetical protein SALB1_1078 [Salinisphaera sp. LB1]
MLVLLRVGSGAASPRTKLDSPVAEHEIHASDLLNYVQSSVQALRVPLLAHLKQQCLDLASYLRSFACICGQNAPAYSAR